MTAERCAVGIVFALPIEADAFARQITDAEEICGGGLTFHQGIVAGTTVAWCVGGVGRERAARATQLLIDGHRPRRLISAGFAGGLAVDLTRGCLVRPGAVRSVASDRQLPLAVNPTDPTAGRLLLITVDRIVCTPADKTELAEATGAALVDMETIAVAEVAAAAAIPCSSLRVVSDAATDTVPADVGRLIQPQSTVRRLGSLVGLLGRRPRAASDLWRLWERAVVDGTTLASGLDRLIAELAEEPSRSGLSPDREGRKHAAG
jgi:adenosylhomocysteine nucleosidase